MILRLSHDIIIHRPYLLLFDGHSLYHTCFFFSLKVVKKQVHILSSHHRRPQQCLRRNNQFSLDASVWTARRGGFCVSSYSKAHRHCVICLYWFRLPCHFVPTIFQSSSADPSQNVVPSSRHGTSRIPTIRPVTDPSNK